MSIYSGFATRNQESTYDNLVEDLIYVLQKRIMKFYQNQPTEESKFYSIVADIYHQLQFMEKSKYLEPKTSKTVFQFIDFLKQRNPHMMQQNQIDTMPKKKANSFAFPEKMQLKAVNSIAELNQTSLKRFGKIRHQINQQLSSQNDNIHNKDSSFDSLNTQIRPNTSQAPDKEAFMNKLMSRQNPQKQIISEYINRQMNKGNYRKKRLVSKTYAIRDIK